MKLKKNDKIERRTNETNEKIIKISRKTNQLQNRYWISQQN